MGGCQSSTIDETSPLHSMHPNHQWLRDLLQKGVHKIEFAEDGVKLLLRSEDEPIQNTCPNFKVLEPVLFKVLGVPIGFYNPKTGMFDKPEGNMNVCKTLTVLGKGGFGKVEAIKCGGNFFARKTMFEPKYLDHERSGSDYMYEVFKNKQKLSSALNPEIRRSLDDEKTNTHVRLVKGLILHPTLRPTQNLSGLIRSFNDEMKNWWADMIMNGEFTTFCQNVIDAFDVAAGNDATKDALKYNSEPLLIDTSRYFTDFKPENIMWSKESNNFVLIDPGSVSRDMKRCYTGWFAGYLIGGDDPIYMTNRDVMIMSMAMTFSYIGQYTEKQGYLQRFKDEGIDLINKKASSSIKGMMIRSVRLLQATDKYVGQLGGNGNGESKGNEWKGKFGPFQSVFVNEKGNIGPYHPSIPYEFDTIDIGEAMRGTIAGLPRPQLQPLLSDEPRKLPGKLPEGFERLEYDRPQVLKQGGGGYRAAAIASGLAVTAAAAFAPR